MTSENSIIQNLQCIMQRISNNEKNMATTLIAVSKRQPVEKIEEALKAGCRVFGENKVQEAHEKWPSLRTRHPQCELHLIGPLQTNKIASALDIFDVIQTVDRKKLAKMLAKEKVKRDFFPECFIQINVGEEEQKSGISLKESDDFIVYCIKELQLPITGLMCIPPKGKPPAPYFTLLATIAKRHNLQKISMGMSSDFEEAIVCGATHVRVGSAIFGERG